MQNSPLLTVTAVNWKGHYKRLQLERGARYLTVPLSACVSKGDNIRIKTGDAWVVCKNGNAQILGPYTAEEIIRIGNAKLKVLVKEITEEDEHIAYLNLSDFHYRGHIIHGRTARLILRTFHPLYPKVIGYIELATPFYMNKARSMILDAPFKNGDIQWAKWDMQSLKKYIHVFVRIARTVVSPEFRGLGIGQILVKHAAQFARHRWQVAGYLPYFIEISADMLKYIPFAEKAGMSFVGETEGNLSRAAKDMTYLIQRFGNEDSWSKANFEESSGICDKQIMRMDSALNLMKREGMSLEELNERLQNLSKKNVLREYALFHNIVSLPKPHYMQGLIPEASKFLNNRIKALGPKNGHNPPKINIPPITTPIRFNCLSVSYLSHVRRTISTHAVQQAFGISPDEIRTKIIEDLSLTVDPGEILLIIGPSGSGKTTLLNVMTSKIKKESNVSVGGDIELPWDAKVATFKAIRSQKPLIEVLGAKDINYGLHLMGLAGLSEVFLYLKRFQELSKGQQYRAMLARLIASRSNVWIADEFCSNLDSVTANVVAHNVQRTARKLGATVIAAVPHCTNFVSSLRPDKVLLLTSTWEHSVISGEKYCNIADGLQYHDGSPPTLRLKHKFMSAVREGHKYTTVRRGRKKFLIGFMLLESDQEKIPVNVTDVRYKRFSDLTEDDAKMDGAGDLDTLRRTLRLIYPNIRLNNHVTIVHFKPFFGEILNANND